MSVNSSPLFQQTWNRSISIETENTHASKALWYHVATIVTAVAFVALAAVSSILFPEFATLMIIGALVLSSPGIELCKHFLSKAQEAKKLEEQAKNVRECYQKNILNKEKNPEIKALCSHWKEQAKKQQKNYEAIYQKSIEKETELDENSFSLQKYRLNALEAEKTAKTVTVYALFLETLIQDQASFESAFCKHGERLSQSISSFAKWDSRENERRAMDPLFSNKDDLLLFNNLSITPISYSEVNLDSVNESLKSRLYQAFKEAQIA